MANHDKLVYIQAFIKRINGEMIPLVRLAEKISKQKEIDEWYRAILYADNKI